VSFGIDSDFGGNRDFRGRRAGFGRAVYFVISKTSISFTVKFIEPVKKVGSVPDGVCVAVLVNTNVTKQWTQRGTAHDHLVLLFGL
jgi:hypothetical protein